VFQYFKQLKPKYLGEGINHEGQQFKASFEVSSSPEIDGISFHFQARSNSGFPFHLESSLVGKGISGKPALWVLSSNHPGVFERQLVFEEKTPAGTKFIFAFGKKEDRNSFREEIHIEIADQTVRYVYFWGMPGGDFAERSGCLMKAVE
jgi:hypothetical protein